MKREILDYVEDIIESTKSALEFVKGMGYEDFEKAGCSTLAKVPSWWRRCLCREYPSDGPTVEVYGRLSGAWITIDSFGQTHPRNQSWQSRFESYRSALKG